MYIVFKLVFALTIPIVVLWVGDLMMNKISNRQLVKKQLNSKAKSEHQKPLNMRISGYNLEDVKHHWGLLDEIALKIEKYFLKLDLIFPFFYGAALVFGLLIIWMMLDKPFSLFWLILPVIIILFADWTENLIQLKQIQLYIDNGGGSLQSFWIQIASIATILKLIFFVISYLCIIGLTLCFVFRK